jgi:ech hydrogenase subunit D
MPGEQEYLTITKDELVTEVTRRKMQGWRLSQISATRKDGYDLLYTLEKEYDMVNLRVLLRDGETVDSVSAVYPYSYLYENEMKDLFGVPIVGMNVDFGGKLYQIAVETPFKGDAAEGEVAQNG